MHEWFEQLAAGKPVTFEARHSYLACELMRYCARFCHRPACLEWDGDRWVVSLRDATDGAV